MPGMRSQLLSSGLVLAAMAACVPASDNGDYPPRGGGVGGGSGGSGSGSGTADAGTDGGSSVGRVCLTTDLRKPEVCAATGAAGIAVKRGTVTMTTAADGTFALPPSSERGDYLASRTDLVTAVVPYVAGAQVIIPMVATTTWNQLRQDNSMILIDGQGSLLVAAVRPNGLYKAQVVVSTEPATTSGVFYDTTNVQLWGREATGALGVALATGLPAGVANVAGIAANGSRSLPQVPIVENAITFVRLDFLQ